MGDARVFEATVEAAVAGQTADARIIQASVEAAVTGQTTEARVYGQLIEIALLIGGFEPIAAQPIASAEAIGTPVLIHALTAIPESVPSGQDVPAVRIVAGIRPDAIGSEEDVGEPVLGGIIAPDPINSTESVGSPTVGVVPAWVVLQLDTTPPTVTWGAHTGTTAGELLQLAYTTDEPIARATVTLTGGQVLAVTVGESTLSVLLPPDAYQGPATVAVFDDVGNARGYPALVTIIGTPYVPPAPAPTPRRLGGPLRRTRSRVIRSHAPARARTTCSVRAGLVRMIDYSETTTSTLRTARQHTPSTSPLTASRVQARLHGAGASMALGVETTASRRDGPDLELLLLLD